MIFQEGSYGCLVTEIGKSWDEAVVSPLPSLCACPEVVRIKQFVSSLDFI